MASKNQKTQIIDMTNPYHLHSSDYSGSTLVTKQLIGNNYATWSRTMSITISAKNKIGFVDGSIERTLQTSKKLGS